jgi:glyoxylase-like metal-dependent hydrolase (beta-lactamase superfamily II)
VSEPAAGTASPLAGQSNGPALEVGLAVAVAPGVRRVLAPNPGMMTGPGTNTYLVGDDEVAVIDPGPDEPAHLDAILSAAAGRVRWILVTHTHIDHSPLAAALRAATGAPTLGFGPAPTLASPGLDGHDRVFVPDRLLADGDRLDSREFLIAAVHTPGHASNHLCFELVGDGLLFSGDHVMQGSTVVIAPPDGDMTLYLESLDRVRRLGLRRIAPGHGQIIDDPAAVLDEYLRHRLAREAAIAGQVARADRDHSVSIEQLVEIVYTDVPDQLHPIARFSVWAHLRKLAEEGRACSGDVEDIAAPWWTCDPGPRDRGSV